VQQIATQEFTWKVSVTAIQGKLADCIRKGTGTDWNLQRLAINVQRLQVVIDTISTMNIDVYDVTMKLKPVYEALPIEYQQ
jgi:hypothetical protein